MIRILIRQVSDPRHQAPKSLGIADIEPLVQLPLGPPGSRADFEVRLYYPHPHNDRIRARACFVAPKGKTADCWDLAIAALHALFKKP